MTFKPTHAGGPTVEFPTSASTSTGVRPSDSACRAASNARVVLPVSRPPMSIDTPPEATSFTSTSWELSAMIVNIGSTL